MSARESRVLGGTSQFSMGSLLVRKRKGPQEIPSLQQLCVYSVIDNIDKLQCVGDVPNDLLSPILRKCNAQQLWRIESASKRDLNTEHLWKRHCESLGVNGKEEKESWKQTWSKEMKRQAEKQKNLGSKLRKMYNEASEVKQQKQVRVLSVQPPLKRRKVLPTGSTTGGARRASYPSSSVPTNSRERLAKKIGMKTKPNAFRRPPIRSSK